MPRSERYKPHGIHRQAQRRIAGHLVGITAGRVGNPGKYAFAHRSVRDSVPEVVILVFLRAVRGLDIGPVVVPLAGVQVRHHGGVSRFFDRETGSIIRLGLLPVVVGKVNVSQFVQDSGRARQRLQSGLQAGSRLGSPAELHQGSGETGEVAGGAGMGGDKPREQLFRFLFFPEFALDNGQAFQEKGIVRVFRESVLVKSFGLIPQLAPNQLPPMAFLPAPAPEKQGGARLHDFVHYRHGHAGLP